MVDGVTIRDMPVVQVCGLIFAGRAIALDVAVMEFVGAAMLRGEGKNWIIFREILRNTLSPLLAEFYLRFAFVILFLSTLSFPGMGIQPPAAEGWRGQRQQRRRHVRHYGCARARWSVAGLVVCVNLVVDWLLKHTSSLNGGRGDA